MMIVSQILGDTLQGDVKRLIPIVFHFDISGNDNKDEQPLNISLRFLHLSMFHFDISGNDCKFEHLPNNPFILVILYVFHFDISGNDINDEQL